MNNRNYNKIYGIPDKDYFFDSWIVIIITLMWFSPIGLILLFRKASLHRRNLFKAGNISMGIGIFFMVIGTLFLAVAPDIIEDDATANIVLFLISFNFITGLIVFSFGALTKLTSNRYRKYIKLIINRRIEDIDIICKEMKLPKKRVINDLDELISKRYLEKYVIDEKENKIYTPESLIIKQQQEELMRERQEKLQRIVECKSCGANNFLKERIGKCEYCNSYIE